MELNYYIFWEVSLFCAILWAESIQRWMDSMFITVTDNYQYAILSCLLLAQLVLDEIPDEDIVEDTNLRSHLDTLVDYSTTNVIDYDVAPTPDEDLTVDSLMKSTTEEANTPTPTKFASSLRRGVDNSNVSGAEFTPPAKLANKHHIDSKSSTPSIFKPTPYPRKPMTSPLLRPRPLTRPLTRSLTPERTTFSMREDHSILRRASSSIKESDLLICGGLPISPMGQSTSSSPKSDISVSPIGKMHLKSRSQRHGSPYPSSSGKGKGGNDNLRGIKETQTSTPQHLHIS